MAAYYPTEDTGLNIARGIVLGTSHINKFGFTGTDVSGTCTVWDGNGTTAIYPYPAAGVVQIPANTTDDGEEVEIQGLDENYEPLVVTVTIAGAASTETFSRIFRARMVSTPNGANVVINQGVALAATILAGNAQTLMAVYTVPAGKKGYLKKLHGSSDKSTGNPSVKYKLFFREFGKSVFNLKGQFGTAGGNQFDYDYPIPLEFDEKSDIRVDVVTDAATGVGAIFDIILIDN